MSEDFEEETGTFRTLKIKSAFEMVGLPKDVVNRELKPDELTKAFNVAKNLPALEKDSLIEALLLHHNKMQEQLTDSGIDSLTKLPIRKQFDKAFKRELENLAKRPGKALALGVIDLDHFKQFNDQFGHLVGDFILNRAGVRLKKTVRANDFV
ncbi:MAG: GGDEF domain-containing protein, partial [Pseudomonadota bacterium]